MKYSASGTIDPQTWAEDLNFPVDGFILWMVGPRDGRKIFSYNEQGDSPLRACEEVARNFRKKHNSFDAIGIVATDNFGAELAFASIER